MIVGLWRRTQLPLDDVFPCLRNSIFNLTCSSPHRGLERRRTSWLRENRDRASERRKLAEAAIGYVHISKLSLAEGKLNMFLAVDRASKYTYVKFPRRRRFCDENGIEQLPKPYRPWTNGPDRRTNRTIKDVTIKPFHYPRRGMPRSPRPSLLIGQ